MYYCKNTGIEIFEYNFNSNLDYLTLYIFYSIPEALLSKKIQDPVDGVIFAIGIQCVLRQFPNVEMSHYIKYFCDYILSFVANDG